MLTAEQAAQLTEEERWVAFEKLAGAVYRSQAETCAALGIALRTYQVWRKERSCPIMALLAMQSCAIATNRPAALVMDTRAIAAQMETAANAMAEAGRLMASVARRLPDPS